METLTAEAGVSTALIYYHFKDRAGTLRHTLEFISDRYTGDGDGGGNGDGDGDGTPGPNDARQELEQSLLLEFQDLPEVRENSIAWGELRASAIFEPELRGDLARATLTWIHDVAELLGRVRPTAPAPALTASAERLTGLLEGLSTRWLSGALPLPHTHALVREAVALEIEHLSR
ncbi:TetR family transcriptional regulator [Streptomyces sp. SID8356]|uniref:TetR family transcriptional regulator C-terminal domain-containing protein n=1 Tax=unclassified Streptomyces TaxID=2593676 RepID=UPI000367DB7B|nr:MULTISPECIES: TetR family transcriptional regulator C-terminal domain-containing protein [unclassified Streptomyces]MYT37040.1 TetR family transcriptional regulator [Streptomyces sp. SID8356]